MHLTLAEKGGININQSLGVAGRGSGLGFPGDGDRIVRTSQPNWVTRDARWEHSLLLGKGKGAKAHGSGSELLFPTRERVRPTLNLILHFFVLALRESYANDFNSNLYKISCEIPSSP